MEIISASHPAAEGLALPGSATLPHGQPAATGGMRIAVVANTTWYVYNFRRNLMLHLKEMGHELFAVGPEDRYADLFRQEGIPHISVPFHGAGKNPVRELETLLRLRRIFSEHRIDVVLSYTPKGNIYSAFALAGRDGKLVVNVSGLGRAFSREGLLARTVQRLYQQAFRRAEWVFFQNDEDRSTFIDKRIVSHARSSRLPGSGVDLRRFSGVDQATNGSGNAASASPAFLFVARLLWDKGIGEYVEAARLVKQRYPEARFRVLGSIDRGGASAVPEETLRSWVEQGLIDYLGACDDVRPHLAAADCVVLPSFYREGVPRSLLEAAAMRRPVITTDAVGCRDTVDDQLTGLLCKPRDSADLAEKICRFIAMPPAERVLMGSRAREKMERDFDERIVIDAYSALLHAPQAEAGQHAGAAPAASA